MSRIAVVTGSNKGIGLAIVKILATQNPSWIVYLTSRDVARGEEAVKGLGLANVNYHQLDVCAPPTIAKFAEYLKAAHGGLDILINNAGIVYNEDSTAPQAEQAEMTCATNFHGLLAVCHALIPLIRDSGRIVHVASRAAAWGYKFLSEEYKAKVEAYTTPDEVIAHIKAFVDAIKAGDNEEKGLGDSAYATSKLGVVLLTPMMQKKLDSMGKKIVVNCCCPNYVNTDMTSGKGTKTVEFGAEVEVYLATLPEGTDIRGKFVVEREIISYKEEWKFDDNSNIVRA